MRGISSWRNIIAGGVISGEVTEINAHAVMALRCAAEFCDEPRHARAADALRDAPNAHLWRGDNYLLTHFEGTDDRQVTGDTVFPALWGIAPPERAGVVLDRLARPDFWTPYGPAHRPPFRPA